MAISNQKRLLTLDIFRLTLAQTLTSYWVMSKLTSEPYTHVR